ncbi:MAG: phosphoglucosamine mutase, partial [Planctomycetota bacterium]|nr:phosphoglucosamine mutase [Planctomycetota bacterium]
MTDAPLMLSVSGARGIVGVTMTPAVAERYAAAWGTHLRSQTEGEVRIVLGRDPRPSGVELVAAARCGLQAAGCDVVDLGIAATPTVGFAVERFGAAGGLMVTASHNPIEWNGIKCLDHRGVAPPPAVAKQVIARFQNNDVQTGGSGQSVSDDSLTRQHVERALEAVPVRGVPGSVVLDSVNGAGCEGGRELFASLGVPYEHLYGEPHGVFARPAEPIPAHLGDVCDRVRDSDAVVGFAQDPDADRLVLVDECGVPIHEECTLALAATWVLRHRG